MKAKKTKKADLQNKRLLFFEIGLVAALAAVIFTLSRGRAENVVSAGYAMLNTVEYTPELPPPTKNDVEVKKVAAPNIDFSKFTIVPDTKKIEIDYTDFIDPETQIFIPAVKHREDPVEDKIFVQVQDMPKFMDGGLDKFRDWVMRNMLYPALAAETAIQGKVIVEFVVEKDGTVAGITVLQTPDRILSEEVVRVLAVAPRWKPGMQMDKPARVKFTMPVEFKLN